MASNSPTRADHSRRSECMAGESDIRLNDPTSAMTFFRILHSGRPGGEHFSLPAIAEKRKNGKELHMGAHHHGRRYRNAVLALRARAEVQECWSCGKVLFASAPKGHPQSITLGHFVSIEDGGSLLDPNNYEAQCMACNYRDGQRIASRKRAGSPAGVIFRNPRY